MWAENKAINPMFSSRLSEPVISYQAKRVFTPCISHQNRCPTISCPHILVASAFFKPQKFHVTLTSTLILLWFIFLFCTSLLLELIVLYFVSITQSVINQDVANISMN